MIIRAFVLPSWSFLSWLVINCMHLFAGSEWGLRGNTEAIWKHPQTVQTVHFLEGKTLFCTVCTQWQGNTLAQSGQFHHSRSAKNECFFLSFQHQHIPNYTWGSVWLYYGMHPFLTGPRQVCLFINNLMLCLPDASRVFLDLQDTSWNFLTLPDDSLCFLLPHVACWLLMTGFFLLLFV